VVEVLFDTDGNGVADQREVYEDGRRVRLDVDTDGNRKPDVAQYYSGDTLTRQDEDRDGDGAIDARFEGEKAVPVVVVEALPGAPFGEVDCGRFSPFWARR
jgi:hypothetical protein